MNRIKVKGFKPDIIVSSTAEFSQLFDCSIRTDLSDMIIDKVISNISEDVQQVGGIRIYIKDTDSAIELTIRRDEFLEILEEHLKIYENLEMYEICAKIYEGIKKIKIGNLVDVVKTSKRRKKVSKNID